MREGSPRPWLALTVVSGLFLATALPILAGTLGPGMSGTSVRLLQRDLAYLGYLDCLPTGYYGSQTRRAVKTFQQANGLKPDGIAGPRTQAVLAQRVRAKNEALSSRRNDGIGLLPWAEVDRLFPRGTTARVWDIATRKSLVVWRFQGSYHADVEPLTREDTAILLEICGGRWSKARRAALVEIQGRLVAASIYPFPHGREGIHDNGFKGQFCLHFLGSRVHNSGRVDPTHQEMVMRAAQAYPQWQASLLASAAAPEASPDSTSGIPDRPEAEWTAMPNP